MTTTAEPAIVADQVSTRTSAAAPQADGQRWWWRWPATVAAASAGTVIIGLSYRLSAQGYSAQVYYIVFWLGLLTAMLPVVARLVAPTGTRVSRLWGVLLFAVITAIPKYLRNPTGPSYHDEYAHWREAIDVLGAGHLFVPNTTIPIVEYFPGTSALTLASHALSGLDIWSSGLIVVFTMHVLGLFAVYLLGESLLSSARAGAIAALVYGVNPSSIYFDTQYAYESIAINLFLWTLALTALAATAERTRTRRALSCSAVLVAAGCVVTHHLSTVFLIAALITVAMTGAVRQRSDRRRERRDGADAVGRQRLSVWWTTLCATVSLAIAWVALCARPTLDYLSPYFGSSVRQLGSVAETKGHAGRELLATSVQPEWERLLTAAAPAAVLGLAVAAFLLVRRHQIRFQGPTLGLMAFGLAYFISLPFVLAPSGAEGARRSWGFTYVGIALIIAFVATRWPESQRAPFSRRWRQPLILLVFVVLLIGNVGGGLNDPYRFPGPFRWGTDTNSASAEARSVAEQLDGNVGRAWVVSDAYTALQLAAYGGLVIAAPSPGFPAWELTQSDTDPRPELAQMLTTSHYDYLVVDIRMAEQPAFNGHNFGQGDPLLGMATPMANLTRLDSVPWASRVISTEHLRVYRLKLDSLASRGARG